MLLRYVALHGCPRTEEDWAAFKAWQAKQLKLAECHMADVEGSPTEDCEACEGRPDCPKAQRRK